MSVYQFLVPILSFLMVLNGVSRYRRGEKTTRELVTLALIWLILALISLFPSPIVKFIESVTGIKSGINAIIFFCLVLLFYAVFRLMVHTEKLEQGLTELVRKDAFEKYEKLKMKK